MTTRQIRRAAERAARKKQRKAANGFVFSTPDVAPVSESSAAASTAPDLEPAPVSEAQLAANRMNSQLSTGPKTPEGKAKSSLNAVKNALTGRTVLLPSDDAALYERHVARFLSEYKPVGERETELVQSLADTQWRLNRIPSLEMGIYALARINFKDNMFEEEEPTVREALIQAHTFITHQKQLNNLSIQEARLRRHYQKDLAELKQLVAARLASPPKNGFLFSSQFGSPDPLTHFPEPPDPITERSDGLQLARSAGINSLSVSTR